MSELDTELRQAFDSIPTVPLEQARSTAGRRRRRRKLQGAGAAAVGVLVATGIVVAIAASPKPAKVKVPSVGPSPTTISGKPTDSTPPATHCALTKRFSNGSLQFDYPACWTATTYSEASSFSSSIVYLSDQATHEPCKAINSGTIYGRTCGWPIDTLGTGHVIIQWSANGFPGWNLSKAAGTATTIGGHPARIDVSRPGQCSSIGANVTISAAIARTVPDNWYNMTACINSSDEVQAAKQVQEMLSTVAFVGPP